MRCSVCSANLFVLFGLSPYHFSCPARSTWARISQLVAGDPNRPLLNPFQVWEHRMFNIYSQRLIRLIHRVLTPECVAPLCCGLIFLRSAPQSIVGCVFRPALRAQL
jgi:hypothetical protein